MFEYFAYWSPDIKAVFIFSCCIGVVLWAAALALAVADVKESRRRQVGGTPHASGTCSGHDMRLAIPMCAPDTAILCRLSLKDSQQACWLSQPPP